MSQAYKISRHQPSIFQPEHNWRRSLNRLFAVLWAVLWVAVAVWLLAGGAESRQVIGSALRSLSQLFREAFAALAGLLN